MGKIIKDLRLSKGLTQQELADLLGVSDKAISKWETGGGYPDISLLPELAKVFSVNLDYLMTGKEPVPMTLSEFEHLAKYGDELLYKSLKSKNHLFSIYNEYGKELMDYVLQYENTKIFNLLVSEGSFSNWMKNRMSRQVTDQEILYLMIISNNQYLLNKHGRKLRIDVNKPLDGVDKLIHVLFTDERVSSATKELIMGFPNFRIRNLFLNYFLSELIRLDDSEYLPQLIERCIHINESALKQFAEQERLNPIHTKTIREMESFNGNFYIEDLVDTKFSIIKKEVYELALSTKQYHLVSMFNRINQLVPNKYIFILEQKMFKV